jgi:hypothetical protein
MTLVPMSDPAFGDFQMAVQFEPVTPRRGRLTLVFRHPDTGAIVTSFLTVHEQPLHLFVVGRRLDYFAHVHPALRPDGRFAIDLDVPDPGAYRIVADVYPAGGTPQLLQATWVTSDYRGSPFPDRDAVLPDLQPKTDGATRVELSTAPLVAESGARLTFTLTDARTGRPVTDLERYLGAPGHLFVASDDLSHVAHVHPDDAASTGPLVSFDTTFPRPGRYKLWAQFQRAGTVITLSFVVDVGGRG